MTHRCRVPILTQALNEGTRPQTTSQLQGEEENHPQAGLQKNGLLCNKNQHNEKEKGTTAWGKGLYQP